MKDHGAHVRGAISCGRLVVLHCAVCGSEFPIRRIGDRRPRHVKHLWCRVCKDSTPHVQRRRL